AAVCMADAADEIVAILIRHADVADENVRSAALKKLKRFGNARGADDLRATALENPANQVARVGLVIDDKNAQARQGRKLVPVQRLGSGGARAGVGGSGLANRRLRKSDGEGGASAGSFA